MPLIKDDIAKGDEAAECAGLPYYKAAGEKLREARKRFMTAALDHKSHTNGTVPAVSDFGCGGWAATALSAPVGACRVDKPRSHRHAVALIG